MNYLLYYNDDVTYTSHVDYTEDEAAADTCTAPESGNWPITCSDNCVWDDDFTVPADIIITGSGTLNLNAKMDLTSANWEIYKEDGCTLAINSGGSIE